MSPHLTDISQVEFDNFHCSEKQNETHDRSELKGSNDLIVDDKSVSDNESCKHGATCLENNAMDEYVLYKNYNPKWMEMDGDYKKNITTELKWTYLDEPSFKEGMYDYDGPGPCLKNFSSFISMIHWRHVL